MELWQKQHIEKNLVELIKKTRCDAPLLTHLKAGEILAEHDVQVVELQHLTSFEKAKKLYEILTTRTGAYDVLVKSLKETEQTGALEILTEHSQVFRLYGTIQYDKNHILGSGNTGTTVFKGKFDNRDVAVKVINVDVVKIKTALREVESLKILDAHENIVRYFMAERKDNFVFIALELCKISLADEVKMNIVNIEPVTILQKCTNGVAHLHKNNILHRDLKPANVLLTASGQVKISDFGLSKQLTPGMSTAGVNTGAVGTVDWMAPEILEYQMEELEIGGELIQSTCADIFSLGCIFFFVLSKGAHPFGKGVLIPGNILTGKMQITNSKLDVAWQQTIERMIAHDPAHRPSAHDILSGVSFTLSPHLVLMREAESTAGSTASLRPEHTQSISSSQQLVGTSVSRNTVDNLKSSEDQENSLGENQLQSSVSNKDTNGNAVQCGSELVTERKLTSKVYCAKVETETTGYEIVKEERTVPQVKALYAFQGEDIEVEKGEFMFLLNKTNSDWWNVKKVNGEDGFLPANYVKEIDAKVVMVQVRKPIIFSGGENTS